MFADVPHARVRGAFSTSRGAMLRADPTAPPLQTYSPAASPPLQRPELTEQETPQQTHMGLGWAAHASPVLPQKRPPGCYIPWPSLYCCKEQYNRHVAAGLRSARVGSGGGVILYPSSRQM